MCWVIICLVIIYNMCWAKIVLNVPDAIQHSITGPHQAEKGKNAGWL